ncbi:hypothetical protein phiKpS2_20 [Klebsiella phage phiKpS2]|uniref:Transmembrane protein n=3 Tax=Drulisvirus TaxID=1920774 RepID=A0A2S1ZEN3_9CAUD|nr:hypothetical protein HOS10_gp20 [Klebsiella phage phiKpS2]AWK24014.1 hypothetical protein phiKpS2_20 [Klebsiella phage phiKpS2]
MVVGLVVLNNIEVMMKMGICSVLGLIFVTLKLTGVIAWSWLWVLLPFWGPIVVGVVLVFLVAALKTASR